ncbi:penicillin-binding protein activator [Corallincola platygyrae]|uniref:Penicillin-binding protein activator n=1 Tax=Corallincola platygyrae TaxID=1193278 RepID=A0ABW4XRS0_9GAMM
MSILPRLTASLTILFLVAACTPTPVPEEKAPEVNIETVGQPTAPAADYLQKAKTAQGDARQAYLLLAARAHLLEGQQELARSAYETVQVPLNLEDQRLEYSFLGAEFALYRGATREAIELVESLKPETLSDEAKINAYHLLARAQLASGNRIEAARALVELDPSLNAEQQVENHQHIWNYLKPLTPFALEVNQEAPAPDPFTGWLKLMALTKTMVTRPAGMVDALEGWRLEFPEHPAATSLPAELQTALETRPFAPQNIAVLLPLSGRFQSQGEAIRDGMVYGYLQQATPGLTITYYDTASEGVLKAYESAMMAESDFVIGPLLKGNIDTLLNEGELSVPVLALNRLELDKMQPNLFAFPLAPEDEAVQAAQKMWKDGHRYPLLLLPKGGLGNRIAGAFKQSWEQLVADNGLDAGDDSSQSIEIQFYSDRKAMQKLVQQALGVNESQARILHMKRLLGSSIEVEPRSRRDIDAVYLFSNPTETRLLKPFVDVTVSPFADPLPIYASSRSHDKGLTDAQTRELTGVVFSEIPLLLPASDTQSATLASVKTLWPQRRASEQRLFALGLDAYQVIGQLAQMRAFPGFSVEGMTGRLQVNEYGYISRELNWAKMRNGSAELLPRQVESEVAPQS